MPCHEACRRLPSSTRRLPPQPATAIPCSARCVVARQDRHLLTGLVAQALESVHPAGRRHTLCCRSKPLMPCCRPAYPPTRPQNITDALQCNRRFPWSTVVYRGLSVAPTDFFADSGNPPLEQKSLYGSKTCTTTCGVAEGLTRGPTLWITALPEPSAACHGGSTREDFHNPTV